MGKKVGSKKTGGRKSGTPNKVTNDLRQWIYKLLEDNKESFEDDLNDISPIERIKILCGLLNYALPKMQPEPPEEADIPKNMKNGIPIEEWIKEEFEKHNDEASTDKD
jgi:hypothetical protein